MAAQYTRKRVVDAGGKLVLEEGEQLLAPVLTRGTPIKVAGSEVGRVEIEVSLRNLLYMTGLVAGSSVRCSDSVCTSPCGYFPFGY
jgi:hypothetical protein